MAEALTLDRVRNAGWHDALLGCITGHLKDPGNTAVRDKILEAIERDGMVSKAVISVVGIYQRQTITTPGLYKDLVLMNDAISQGKAPPVNGAPEVPPVVIPEPVMTVTEHIERPSPTPEAHPVPDPPVISGCAVVPPVPPAEVHVEPAPLEAEHEAPVSGKPSGNLFRRKSSAFYFLEVMRDGGPRSREDAVAVALKRWPASEIGENASILHKLNWSMFLRQVRDGKADAHGWTYGLEKVDGTRVKLLVKPPAASGDSLPEPPADAMPAWADPPVVTPTHPEPTKQVLIVDGEVVAVGRGLFPPSGPVIPAPVIHEAATAMLRDGVPAAAVSELVADVEGDLRLLQTYREAAHEAKLIEDHLLVLRGEVAKLQDDLENAREEMERVGGKLLERLER